MGIRQLLPDFQARWESPFFDSSAGRLFNSLGGGKICDRSALAAVAAQPRSSYRSRHRRICRSLSPMISAACHHVIFFAMARSITSCTFIARPTAALGTVSTLPTMEKSSPLAMRTFHVLFPPDISCANDT